MGYSKNRFNKPKKNNISALLKKISKQGFTFVNTVSLKEDKKWSKVFKRYELRCTYCRETSLFVVGDIHDGTLVCPHCIRDYNATYVYLFKLTKDDYSWLKLGISSHIENRIQQYGIKKPFTCEILHTTKLPNTERALCIEQNIHSALRDKRIDPEHIAKYHTKSGKTECYELEHQDELLSLLRSS